jgi:hypothetical protein
MLAIQAHYHAQHILAERLYEYGSNFAEGWNFAPTTTKPWPLTGSLNKWPRCRIKMPRGKSTPLETRPQSTYKSGKVV